MHKLTPLIDGEEDSELVAWLLLAVETSAGIPVGLSCAPSPRVSVLGTVSFLYCFLSKVLSEPTAAPPTEVSPSSADPELLDVVLQE